MESQDGKLGREKRLTEGVVADIELLELEDVAAISGVRIPFLWLSMRELELCAAWTVRLERVYGSTSMLGQFDAECAIVSLLIVSYLQW